MDKKFMNIKRIILPVMTVVVLTSQLMGCASVSSKEMLEMLNQGESIEIEVAMPAYYEDEQGTPSMLAWKELGSLDTYKEFRSVFDDTFLNYSFGEGQKNGPSYIDLEGNWTNNSTLYYAMLNKVFAEKLASTDATDTLSEAIQNVYVDIDENDSATNIQSAVINAYFDIFKDNEVGYANINSTLSRFEFLLGLTKADTPVDMELPYNELLKNLAGEDLEARIASQSIQYSYLDLESRSFDEFTCEGTISRAEAIYSIVQKYFSEEYNSVTGREEAYADTKNAGDIALRAGFTDKNSSETKYHLKAYVLASMLQNPDKGMDEEFYKAMVVAKQQGLITGTDSNWDEALTKGEAIQLFLNTYKAIVSRDGYATTSDQGINEGTAIDRETSTSEGSSSNENISGTGYDSKTDEEIEAELEAEASSNTSGGSGVDEHGNVLPENDNNGQGWDIGGKHYDTMGDYLEEFNAAVEENPNKLTEEEWDAIKEGIKNPNGYMVEQ